jgi:hypothetical protein
MKNIMLLLILTGFLVIGSSVKGYCQWTDDPMVNTTISDKPVIYGAPLIAETPEGKYIITWFGGESNPNLNLQILNHDGTEVMPNSGIVVSDYPQDFTIYSYRTLIDHEGNIVIAFEDLRSGNLLPVVYKVSQDGTLLFGDGIQPEVNEDFNINLTMCITSDNEIVVAWEMTIEGKIQIIVYRISATGELLWGANPLILSDAEKDYTNPVLIDDDDEGFILGYYKQTRPSWSAVRSIYAQKYDRDGNPLWPEEIDVFDGNGIPSFATLTAISDSNNGIIFYWLDDRDYNVAQNPAVQHLLSDGTPEYPQNGIEVLVPDEYNYNNLIVSGITSMGQIVAFWTRDCPIGPYQRTSLMCQKLSPVGGRMLGDHGMILISVSRELNYLCYATMKNDTSYGIYSYYNDTITGTDALYAIAINNKGLRVWDNDVCVAADFSYKSSMVMSPGDGNQMVVIWDDYSNDSVWSVKAQNFHTDGSLGNNSVAIDEKSAVPVHNAWSDGNRLYIRDNKQISVITLYSITGQAMHEYANIGHEIDLRDVPAGLYLAVIMSKGNMPPETVKVCIGR